MVARPRLKEQFRPLRRGRGSVQLGLDPAVGVILEGLADDEIRLLERLDGTLDEPAATAWAGEHGIPPERVATLLATLRSHALTVDSPAHRLDFAGLPVPLRTTLRPDAEALACAYRSDDDGYAVLGRRTQRRVLVVGAGSLPAALAQVLRQAGVGHVLGGPYAGEEAAAGRPDLVVLTGSGALDADGALPWMRRRTAHLPVVLSGTRAEVGPLVLPGAGPCLRCLDLARSDHDPGWPAVLAQLSPPRVGPPTEASGETSLVFATAGVAAMAVLAALDGQPHPLGASFEIGLPVPRLAERVWAAHPHCPCGAAVSAAGATVAVPSSAGAASAGPSSPPEGAGDATRSTGREGARHPAGGPEHGSAPRSGTMAV
jgi:bacteriocin biosynthesis cyclodehydratase domain-containing protein